MGTKIQEIHITPGCYQRFPPGDRAQISEDLPVKYPNVLKSGSDFMSTKIEWCDETWNPIKMCCTPVSEGCQNCYALRMLGRNLPGMKGYPKNGHAVFDEKEWQKPEKWKKPRRIFVCSMGDPFHHHVPIGYLNDVFAMIRACPQHTFILLTKRPDTALGYSREIPRLGLSWPDNAWIGVSAENQRTADERIPILLQIPAAVHIVSVEPMLGPVDLDKVPPHYFDEDEGDYTCAVADLNWVICGGETGPRARTLYPLWALRLQGQCQRAGIPFFFKQWGPDGAIESIMKEMVREWPTSHSPVKVAGGNDA